MTPPDSTLQAGSKNTDSELVIRTLYEIAGEYDLGFEHQIRRILELGLKRFELDIGILANVCDRNYKVIKQVSPPEITLEDGAEFPLGDTYCSIALSANGPVGFEHVSTSSIATHPAYRNFGLESYVGMPVRVKNEVYGTLNFSSPEPKLRAFSEVDIEALRLMAAWVGSELSRRQTEDELKTAKEMLEQQSREDLLTRLYNRRGVEDMLLRLADQHEHEGRALVGIVIDVDNFKSINDVFGHSVGDRVLVAIAAAISDSVRPADICGRVGGDEFMVLLPSCPLSEAGTIAERIRASVDALQIETTTDPVSPSVSIGVVPLPPNVRGVTDALEASDPALRSAKAVGKNVVAI